MSLTLTMDILSNSKMPDMDMLCGRWILKQKAGLLGGPTPGTTFPPISHNLPYYKEGFSFGKFVPEERRPECKYLSEPDLSHIDHPESFHDEDYLFEFDGFPASEAESDDLDSERDTTPVITLLEDVQQRRFSVSSDSSSCSHRKESGISADGDLDLGRKVESQLMDMFGSVSSGIGSERRSSQGEGLDVERLEGLSVDPSLWKESCALYLGSSSTRTTDISTSIPSASPQISPLVSPDSCLEEENVLEYQNLCIECATEQSFQTRDQETPTTTISAGTDQSLDTRVTWGKPDPATDNLQQEISSLNNTENALLSHNVDAEPSKEVPIEIEKTLTAEPTSIRKVDKLIVEESKVATRNFEPQKIEINAGLHVTTEKLSSLFKQLEVDKLYPHQENDLMFDSTSIQLQEDPLYERPKLRKCKSLKTNKSPPETPGVKKYVRFADILGLDLSEVRVFSDEIPKIPKTAFEDLDVNMSDFEIGSPVTKQTFPQQILPPTSTTTNLVPMFNQPGAESNFLQKVMERKVSLENAFMSGGSVICGVVRVLNISFQKSVTVRWTVNDWNTVTDTMCEYVQGSSVGNTDKFSFRLQVGNLPVGSRVQFCLRFDCEGEHWDSNGGGNYVFQVFLSSSSSSRGVPMTKQFSHNSFHPLSQSPSQHGADPWMRFM